MFERDLRTLSFVPRWTITRNIKTQTVAEHSFFVAVYAGQLAKYIGYQGDYGDLYQRALWHDIEECFTGDIPGPTKRNFKKLDDMWLQSEKERRFGTNVPLSGMDTIGAMIIKVANLLDEVFYKATEVQMGNISAKHSLTLSQERLSQAIGQLPLLAEAKAHLRRCVWWAIGEHVSGEDKLPENSDDLAPRV